MSTLIRACRDSNVPKFLAADIPLFNGILSDLFPGISVPSIDYGELQAVVLECIAAQHYKPDQRMS